jgi:hypothetical protein
MKIKLVYTGLRIDGPGEMQRFEGEGGKEYFFKSILGLWVGRMYAAELSEDGRVSMQKRPEDMGDAPKEEEVWHDLHVAAVEHRRRRLEVAASRRGRRASSFLLKPLCDRARKLPLMERFAFADHIRRMILENKSKK